MERLRVNWALQPFGEGWDEVEPDAVVWVEVIRVEQSFAINPSHYVGPGGASAGQPSKYATVGLLIESGRTVWMPFLDIRDAGQISFTDGRHRFAWVRDHGAAALPVATNPARASKLASLFGSRLRICEIRRDAE